jgi:hypothetical protein
MTDTKEEKRDYFLDLPDELLLMIGAYLPLYKLSQLQHLSRRFHRVFQDTHLVSAVLKSMLHIVNNFDVAEDPELVLLHRPTFLHEFRLPYITLRTTQFVVAGIPCHLMGSHILGLEFGDSDVDIAPLVTECDDDDCLPNIHNYMITVPRIPVSKATCVGENLVLHSNTKDIVYENNIEMLIHQLRTRTATKLDIQIRPDWQVVAVSTWAVHLFKAHRLSVCKEKLFRLSAKFGLGRKNSEYLWPYLTLNKGTGLVYCKICARSIFVERPDSFLSPYEFDFDKFTFQDEEVKSTVNQWLEKREKRNKCQIERVFIVSIQTSRQSSDCQKIFYVRVVSTVRAGKLVFEVIMSSLRLSDFSDRYTSDTLQSVLATEKQMYPSDIYLWIKQTTSYVSTGPKRVRAFTALNGRSGRRTYLSTRRGHAISSIIGYCWQNDSNYLMADATFYNRAASPYRGQPWFLQVHCVRQSDLEGVMRFPHCLKAMGDQVIWYSLDRLGSMDKYRDGLIFSRTASPHLSPYASNPEDPRYDVWNSGF